jgi:DNA (cytosine-5)-methyltransferase 1
MELNTFHLFAGTGGGILADILLGHRPVGAVEIEEHPRKVLLQRQLDGVLPRFPVWDDVRTFRADNPECSGYVERLRAIRDRLCVCGGFPCQDISAAGKRAGIEGERSGLWGEMARIVGEVRPRYVLVENSPMLLSPRNRRFLLLKVVASLFGRIRVREIVSLWFRPDVLRVLGDFAQMGYDARWGIVGAHHAGAPHKRDRIWILAHSRHGAGRDERAA